MARAYEELFVGYHQDPREILSTTFAETENYDDMVLLKDIKFESTCEHHVAGRASPMSPISRATGWSASRNWRRRCTSMQSDYKSGKRQLRKSPKPLKTPRPQRRGSGHRRSSRCMTNRGVHTHGSNLVTRSFLGDFETDSALRKDFMAAIGGGH